MTPRLSIIIPCYNCETTLREAVSSCYTQGLSEAEFEIIMVDDGSTDNTRTLMGSLSHTHSNIRTLFHPENKGGGAARNTGIKESTGEILYCLDSDNFFAPKSVPRMLQYLEDRTLDGVVFHDRRFFSGSNFKKYHSHINPLLDRPITLADLFSIDKNVLLDNFFYTRAAYLRTAGYPENHGFDTQCFEMRFLAAGNHAEVCNESIFFHRQDPDNNSYFQRVYKAGYFSRNMYLMYEEILHLLSPSTRSIIVQFPIFEKTRLDTKNLKAVLDIHLRHNPDTFFTPQYETLLNPQGKELFLQSIADSAEPTDIFVQAVFAHARGESKTAIAYLTQLLEQGTDSPIIYYNLLRYNLTLTGKYSARKLEDEVARLIATLTPTPQTFTRTSRLAVLGKKLLSTLFTFRS